MLYWAEMVRDRILIVAVASGDVAGKVGIPVSLLDADEPQRCKPVKTRQLVKNAFL